MTSPSAQRSSRPRARTGHGAVLAGVLVALFLAERARAGTQAPLDLRWVAPPGCPQEGDVRGRIQKILGSSRHDSPLRAEGTITRIDRRFRLELVVRIRDLAGTRTIESNSCEDLAGAAAVEIGLLIHSVEAGLEVDAGGNEPPPTSPVRGPEPSRAGSDGKGGQSSPAGNEPRAAERAPDGAQSERQKEVESGVDEPAPRPESQRQWRVLVQLPVGALGVGPLPHPSTGIGLALGFAYTSWQLQLQGLSWRRQNIAAPDFPGYGADVERIAAALWACRELRLSSVGFSPCLTFGTERWTANGTGQNITPSTKRALGMSAGAGVQGRVYLASWIRLLAAVDGEIVLVRPQISLEGLGLPAPSSPEGAATNSGPTPVYRLAPAALTATISLEWAL